MCEDKKKTSLNEESEKKGAGYFLRKKVSLLTPAFVVQSPGENALEIANIETYYYVGYIDCNCQINDYRHYNQ